MLAKLKRNNGQMTVEMCVVFPVIIIIAVIITNSLGFASECASFDRMARNFVRVHAASPKISASTSELESQILSDLKEQFGRVNEDVTVTSTQESVTLRRYKCSLEWWPTLFGLGIKRSVFGISLPSIKHDCELLIGPYKPGDLI